MRLSRMQLDAQMRKYMYLNDIEGLLLLSSMEPRLSDMVEWSIRSILKKRDAINEALKLAGLPAIKD